MTDHYDQEIKKLEAEIDRLNHELTEAERDLELFDAEQRPFFEDWPGPLPARPPNRYLKMREIQRQRQAQEHHAEPSQVPPNEISNVKNPNNDQ